MPDLKANPVMLWNPSTSIPPHLRTTTPWTGDHKSLGVGHLASHLNENLTLNIHFLTRSHFPRTESGLDHSDFVPLPDGGLCRCHQKLSFLEINLTVTQWSRSQTRVWINPDPKQWCCRAVEAPSLGSVQLCPAALTVVWQLTWSLAPVVCGKMTFRSKSTKELQYAWQWLYWFHGVFPKIHVTKFPFIFLSQLPSLKPS